MRRITLALKPSSGGHAASGRVTVAQGRRAVAAHAVLFRAAVRQ